MGSHTINIPRTRYSTDGDAQPLHNCPHLTEQTPRIRTFKNNDPFYLCADCYNEYINSPLCEAACPRLPTNIKLSFVRAISKKENAATTTE